MTHGLAAAAAAKTIGAACMASLRSFFAQDARVLEWGIAPARPTPHADLLRAWVAEKRHADMEYMAARLAERLDPQNLPSLGGIGRRLRLPLSALLGHDFGSLQGGGLCPWG